MLIRAVGQVASEMWYNNNTPQYKVEYYRPQEPKEKVEKDFGAVLEKEIEKLHFDIVI